MIDNFTNEEFRKEFTAEEENDFMEFVKEVDAADRWEETPLDSLYLKEIDMTDAPSLIKERTSTGLALITDGEAFPVFPEAIYSIRRRAKNNAEIFNSLSANECANMLNMSWPHIPGNGKVLIRGGKVLAVHSNRYVPISQGSIFNCFKDKLAAVYGRVSFEGGFYSHESTTCTYEVESSGLLEGLRAALAEEGIKTGDDIGVFVECGTSDTGTSAIIAYPSIKAKGRRNYFTNPIMIEHRDSTTFGDVADGFDQILAVVKAGVVNLERLLKIQLTYPSVIARKLALNSKFQLPKGLVKEIEPMLAVSEFCGEKLSAYDFYFTLCEMFMLPEFKKLTEKRKLRIKDSVARVALFTEEQFKKMDVNDAVW